eukprot:1391605-Amorphochlora_amoeboformis.AAC.2
MAWHGINGCVAAWHGTNGCVEAWHGMNACVEAWHAAIHVETFCKLVYRQCIFMLIYQGVCRVWAVV